VQAATGWACEQAACHEIVIEIASFANEFHRDRITLSQKAHSHSEEVTVTIHSHTIVSMKDASTSQGR
jgi:hypothetical protein